MAGLVDLCVDIATLIESTIVVEKVAVTAGRPAQSDKCSAAYVWGDQIFDAEVGTQERGDIPGCVIHRSYQINWRIDICRQLPDDGSEQTTEQQLTEATTLYDHADDVWCAIAHAIVAGTLFDEANQIGCSQIKVNATVIEEPQGDRVSATGGLRVTHSCPASGS